ncbi:MAG: hypothetical protein K0S26_2131 [Bacteroidota bacterium]|jgi:hypothetical protein|nr:hypothetical protein [Bacteroidota bacterium]
METNEKNVLRTITTTGLLSLITVAAQAESKFVNGVMTEVSKDGFIGFYVFFGVISLAVIAYVTSLIVQKYANKEDKDHHNIRHINRRHHHPHQHRIIKKSA